VDLTQIVTIIFGSPLACNVAASYASTLRWFQPLKFFYRAIALAVQIAWVARLAT
jgi:hypothetical protein